MALELKIADEKDSEIWDSIVHSAGHGTLFHTWRWLNIVKNYTPDHFYPILLFKGTTPAAIYPVFIGRRHHFSIAKSPPSGVYMLYLGPVLANYDTLKQEKRESLFIQVQESMTEYLISHLHCHHIHINTSPRLIDSRPLSWSGFTVEPVYTYRIPLAENTDRVWNNFDRKLRVDIHKAEREGVRVTEGTRNDLEYIHSALSRRFSEQNYQAKDHLRYLNELFDAFHPENLRLFIAHYNGEKVGGMIMLSHKDVCSLWTGVPKTDLCGVSPNDLVQWEGIRFACANGYQFYEEMDSGTNRRLRFFKAKYNPDLCIWYSAKKYPSLLYRGLEFLSKRPIISRIREQVWS